LPELTWKPAGEAHHTFLRHQPEGRECPQLFAVSRRRDGLFDRYGFIACDEAQSDAALVGGRGHRLKPRGMVCPPSKMPDLGHGEGEALSGYGPARRKQVTELRWNNTKAVLGNQNAQRQLRLPQTNAFRSQPQSHRKDRGPSTRTGYRFT
jgi:hypothetical protein